MMFPVNVNYYVFQGTGQNPQINSLSEEFRENVEQIVRPISASVNKASVRRFDVVQTTSEDVTGTNETNGRTKVDTIF